MCEPVTIMTAAAATVGAIAEHKAGQAQKKAGEVQAKLEAQRAAETLRKSSETESEARRVGAHERGAQRALMLGSGIGAEGATFGDIGTGTAALQALDYEAIRREHSNQAWGIQTTGRLAQFQGRAAARVATGKGVGQLLAAGATIAEGWKTGGWGN